MKNILLENGFLSLEPEGVKYMQTLLISGDLWSGLSKLLNEAGAKESPQIDLKGLQESQNELSDKLQTVLDSLEELKSKEIQINSSEESVKKEVKKKKRFSEEAPPPPPPPINDIGSVFAMASNIANLGRS